MIKLVIITYVYPPPPPIFFLFGKKKLACAYFASHNIWSHLWSDLDLPLINLALTTTPSDLSIHEIMRFCKLKARVIYCVLDFFSLSLQELLFWFFYFFFLDWSVKTEECVSIGFFVKRPPCMSAWHGTLECVIWLMYLSEFIINTGGWQQNEKKGQNCLPLSLLFWILLFVCLYCVLCLFV